MKVCAVLLAAGRSERFGSDKLWTPFKGGPLWTASYRTLLSCADEVGIVCQPDRVDEFRALAPEASFVIPGGADRQSSSRLGVEAVPEDCSIVLVHDAARPWVTRELVNRVREAVGRIGAAFPGVPLTDTIKTQRGGCWTTPDRASFLAVQTPQGARRELLLRAHQEGRGAFTDEASLIESLGEPIEAVEGDVKNIKVTHPGDVERYLGTVDVRTGLGYDVHAFSQDPDRPMWLGGVEFDDRPGLEGHSDADALIHAIVDALLGAVGLGDIGLLYSNTDDRWKNAASQLFLRETSQRLAQEGWDIVHVDATVIAERPKVMKRRDEICRTLADAMGLSEGQVSVKATTNEGLGAIGRGEGVAAFAVATVRRSLS